jgi:hypothetical protein
MRFVRYFRHKPIVLFTFLLYMPRSPHLGLTKSVYNINTGGERDRACLPACTRQSPTPSLATFACTHSVAHKAITFILLTHVFRYDFMKWASYLFAFGSSR